MGSFLLCWAQYPLDAAIHRLDVAGVSCNLNLGAELKAIVVGALPGTLLDFAASSTENLEVLLTGIVFVFVFFFLSGLPTNQLTGRVFLPKVNMAVL